jgi:hypothetical protein
VAEIWHRIEGTVAAEDPNAKQKHLLWALVFLKVYATSEDVHCAIVGWPHCLKGSELTIVIYCIVLNFGINLFYIKL